LIYLYLDEENEEYKKGNLNVFSQVMQGLSVLVLTGLFVT